MQKFTGSIVIALVLAFGVASQAFAAELVLDNKAGVNTGIKLVEDGIAAKTATALKFQANVTKLVANEVATEKGTFTALTIPGFQVSGEVGAPAVPVMTRLVEVPLGATLRVKVTGHDVQSVSLASKMGVATRLMPRQPPHPKDGTVVPFAFDAQAYAAPGFQQEELASVEEVGIMRDRRLVQLKVSPVAYSPKTGEIEVHSNINIEVDLEGADMAKTAQVKRVYGSRYFDWAARRTLVPASLKAEPKNRATSYMIIADRKFEAALKPFVDWKTEKGFAVSVSYTDQIGNTAEAIKQHIATVYGSATESTPAPEFVLFVGDNAEIPAHRGTAGSHITDLYFVCVAGDDNIPDIQTGRFSASTVEDLTPQIDKTLYYEKANFEDASFLSSIVMIAGWDYSHAVEWGWPQIKYGVENFFNAAHGLTNVASFLSAGSSQNEPEIVAKVSAGATFVNYTAHGSQTSWGDPGFEISDINNLQNKGKYPLVVGNCCLTNSFQVATCFGEAWLRAPEKGAIGYIGGTNSTYWDEDLWWGNGFYPVLHPNPQGNAPTMEQTGLGAYEGMFDGSYATQGGMVVCGNLAVQESGSSRAKYYWEVYSLMGDPALKPFFGPLQESATTHDTSVAAGATSLSVAAPVGSYVGLTVNGELYGAAHATASKVDVATKPLPAGATVKVVVTGKNLKPYFGTVTVGSGTPDQPTPPQPAPQHAE